ncbi:MAG: DNA polymerase [Candidatus Bathyarchaeota archaeon]|nr:DNA polymerase [Candidatus Bathyarchaeota archaeon]
MAQEKRLKTNIVKSEGPADAKIFFIGEAPGEEEDYELRPFVGSAGQLFNRCINSKSIIRSEVRVGNIFLQRPPANKINYYFRDKSNRHPTWEGEEHIEKLRKLLVELREGEDLNLVVALGAIPTRILTGKNRITKWRGSVLPCTLVDGLKVYPTFHPSGVMRAMQEQEEKKVFGEKKKRVQNMLPLFLLDLDRIKEQAEFKEIRRPEREFYINLDLDDILTRLKEYTENNVDCAVDIETLPSETGPLLWCIGFSNSPAEAFTIPFLRGQRFAWSLEEEVQIVKAISKYFQSEAKKIFQGGGYDLAVLGRYYGLRVKSGTYEDTMWCHQANYPYIRKGLDNLASIYTWEPYYKDEGKVHFGKRSSDSAEFRYNCRDCAVTREIFPVTRRDAHELGTWQNYQRTIDNFPSHLGMTLRGVRIDVKKKSKLTKDFREKAESQRIAIQELVEQEHNPNSSDQNRKLLYGYLGMDIQYNRSTGKVTTDKEALQKLAKRYRKDTLQGKVVSHILKFKKFDKLASTYAEMELDTDGRVRTSYNYVTTWRTSSSGSPFVFDLRKKSQAGGNLQNIPVRSEEGRLIRQLFIPDEGKELLAADYAQAEAMDVAYESENLELIDQFLDKSIDVHWEYTRLIFDIPESVNYIPRAKFRDKYTRQDHTLKELRNIGKATRHGTNYDEGPYRFQSELAKHGFHLEFSVCKKILAAAKAKDPMLAEWKRKIREALKADRFLISSIGDKRSTQARLDDNTYRAFYAFSPQNTVGRMLQIGIQRIHDRYLDRIEPLLNVHDEVVTQIDPKDRAWAIKKIRECMTIPIEIHGREMVIPVDFKVGLNWGEMKEIK